MNRPATDRLKLAPALGRMPTLQFCRPAELRIDPAYQRDVANGASQALIRRIAQHWNWDLCQPLVVARRTDFVDRLFVIDGQHRLEAARVRGDIDQLPCVIVNYASAQDEAASFVHLNQQRRPLTALDLFRAAVASEDQVATAIVGALADASLCLAPHTNYDSWKPGMLGNVGGIQRCWKVYGEAPTRTGLRALSGAFDGQVLRYAGSILPGLVAVCLDEMPDGKPMAEQRFERLQTMLAIRSQEDWRSAIAHERADNPGLRFDLASAVVLRRAWAKSRVDQAPATSAPKPPPSSATRPLRPATALAVAGGDGRAWCDQCDARMTRGEIAGCKSRFCPAKG